MCFKYTTRIFFILSIAQIVISTSDNSEHQMPKNDYVLRSCMSSVELSRRNVEAQSPKFEIPRGRILPIMEPSPRPRVKSNDPNRVKSRGKLNGATRRRPGRKMMTDTPLVTLNLQRRGRHDAPQPFKKNDDLPEVHLSKFREKSDNKEASIILIESA